MMKKTGLACVLSVMVAGLTSFLAGCQETSISTEPATYPTNGTPRLVELGTAVCIPCALMRPGLDELKQEYVGRLDVEVIDTLLTPSAKTQYNAPLCATQLYISASGKELYRHVGFSSKQDILATWKQLGVNLDAPMKQRKAQTPAAPRRQESGA